MAEAAPADSSLLNELQSSQLQEVKYFDRYIKDPFTVRLLIEMLRGLVQCGNQSDPFKLAIYTAEYSHPYRGREPFRFSHDWVEQSTRDSVVDKLVRLVGSSDGLIVRPRWELPHARELHVAFQNGSTCLIRLDQGVSAWRQLSDAAFRFDSTLKEQVERIQALRTKVVARSTEHPTLIYVGCVSHLD